MTLHILTSGALLVGLALILQPGSTAVTGRCAAGCYQHGTCNEELARCDCPRHLSGPDCSQEAASVAKVCKQYGYPGISCTQETPLHCLNNCTSRGRCISGWCQCQPGFYGGDCSLSMDALGTPQQLEGLGFQPAPRGPFIYIYEVPPEFNTWRNIEKFDRPLYVQLWKRITSSGHRTLDPDKADYFYIPTDFRYLRSAAQQVLEYVWTTWPHWNRTGGARHLLLSTSDLGGCEGADLMRIRKATANATWLTAWGLTRKHPNVWWPGCHRPGLDVVIPIPALMPGMILSPLNVAADSPPLERNLTFFFAGKVCGDNQEPKPPGTPWPICQTPVNPLYSAGMRQQVYLHHAHRPGYKIVARSSTYLRDMCTSRFCLAPTGGGHGKRQILVARFGCIPVPITDYVLQPFEPELPWQEFSVTVAEADVPRMHEILATYSDEKVAQMQRALECASRHMWWSSMWGSIFGEDGRYDAFATLMEILAVRLRHPDTPPEDLIKVDEHFAKFARCELGDDTAATRSLLQSGSTAVAEDPGGKAVVTPTTPSPRPPEGTLCYYGYDRQLLRYAPSGFCSLGRWRQYGVPGGAVCEGVPNLAQCPRPWQ